MFTRWLQPTSDLSCLLIGPRRSGKTTLLKRQFPDLKYVTLDDLDYLGWASRDPKGFIRELGGSVMRLISFLRPKRPCTQ